MNNKGFISMTSILAIIVSVSVVLILNIDIKMQNNNLLNKIKAEARTNIKKSDDPICVWSPDINMVITAQGNPTNAITINCKHVKGININSTSTLEQSLALSELNQLQNIGNYFVIPNNLEANYINAYEVSGGYKIILGLRSKTNTPGNYNISLIEKKFCIKNTTICNEQLTSNNINVVNESTRG